TVWAQLFGLVSFEIFGQFNRVVEDRDAFFAHAADGLAQTVGLLRGE
ncbi:TetR-like C-terminal domain-containing protein, partial [Streptomyces beijiangensis]